VQFSCVTRSTALVSVANPAATTRNIHRRISRGRVRPTMRRFHHPALALGAAYYSHGCRNPKIAEDHAIRIG
jgi:hypothetical protein